MNGEETGSLSIGAPPAKSKAARLLELLPAIEAAQRAGHTHASIHEYLVKSKGLDLTFPYYELTLSRLRKRVYLANSIPRTSLPHSQHDHDKVSPNAILVTTTPATRGTTSAIQDVLFGSASDFFS